MEKSDENKQPTDSQRNPRRTTQENWLSNRNYMTEWTTYPAQLHGIETTYTQSEWINLKKHGKTTFTQRSPDKTRLLKAKVAKDGLKDDSKSDTVYMDLPEDDHPQNSTYDSHRKFETTDNIKVTDFNTITAMTPFNPRRKKSFNLTTRQVFSLDKKFEDINRNALNMTFNYMNVKTNAYRNLPKEKIKPMPKEFVAKIKGKGPNQRNMILPRKGKPLLMNDISGRKSFASGIGSDAGHFLQTGGTPRQKLMGMNDYDEPSKQASSLRRLPAMESPILINTDHGATPK